MMNNSLDAKGCAYPCTTCEKNDICRSVECAYWVNWFEIKWREVTTALNKKGNT